MFAQAMLALSLAAPAVCKAQPSLRRPIAAAAAVGRSFAARRGAAALRLAAPAPLAFRGPRLPRLAAKKKPEPEPEPEEDDDEEFEEYEEGEEGEEGEATDIWQVALTVEAPASSLPKDVTHGSFVAMVQETLNKSVPNLPTDEEMAEVELFEKSLLVITDQEDDVPFNCEEDAVYVEMTFFSVEAAEEAVEEAIRSLEAKGWQAEIVDPDTMDEDEEYDEEGEEEEEKK